MSQDLKTIWVKLAGAGKEAGKGKEVTLEPGAKVEDVLNKLDLQNYQLFYNGSFLTPDTDLYSLLSEGSSISASPQSMQVGK